MLGRRRSVGGLSERRRKTSVQLGVASDPLGGASNGLAVRRGGRRRGRRSFGLGEDRPGAIEAPGGGQQRKAMAAGLVGEELSGEKRRWRVLSALGGNGKAGGEWLCYAQGRG